MPKRQAFSAAVRARLPFQPVVSVQKPLLEKLTNTLPSPSAFKSIKDKILGAVSWKDKTDRRAPLAQLVTPEQLAQVYIDPVMKEKRLEEAKELEWANKYFNGDVQILRKVIQSHSNLKLLRHKRASMAPALEGKESMEERVRQALVKVLGKEAIISEDWKQIKLTDWQVKAQFLMECHSLGCPDLADIQLSALESVCDIIKALDEQVQRRQLPEPPKEDPVYTLFAGKSLPPNVSCYAYVPTVRQFVDARLFHGTEAKVVPVTRAMTERAGPILRK